MRVCDVEMIKGVRRVRETGHPYVIDVYVSPWWMWSKKRRTRLEEHLDFTKPAHVHLRLKTWWW
ncbi:hypothetical protein LCGC14_0259320 [marine sediment metagenome]|uniref:Uncharacterized protein n=1 Tax=marine sediment metagenome TaxID=412755 RepID=A0A0F9UJD6_9ZZZZ